MMVVSLFWKELMLYVVIMLIIRLCVLVLDNVFISFMGNVGIKCVLMFRCVNSVESFCIRKFMYFVV